MEPLKTLDSAEVLENLSGNLNSPYVRNIYLHQAACEFESGNVHKSVFYQTEALCLGYRWKYLLNYISDPTAVPYEIPPESNKNPILDNPLLEYAAALAKSSKSENSKKERKPKFETEPQKGIKSIQEFCMSLPKEWTVVQLCKAYNPSTTASLKSEIITAESPIYLTVLKNSQSDLYSDPICLQINIENGETNIYSLLYQITAKLKAGMSMLGNDGDAKKNKLVYNANLASIESDIKEAIEKLRVLFGPWRCFFAGPADRSCRPEEQAIFENVKKFSVENTLDSRQYIILSTLACHAQLLTMNDINTAALEISSDSDISARIKKFLTNIKQTSTPLRCSPCILIVDELLDHFFWETMNEKQEICRMSSLHILQTMYDKYCSKISNGYLKMSANNGKWVLNPDTTLNDMERRISAFITFWDPKMDCVVDRKAPNAETMTEYLKDSDVFIYSGHGSGLQFFNGHKITSLHSNSVVFLLGCDSVRLKSDGLHGEMMGSHMYYFATHCPAVVGAILMAFDRKMDLMTTDMLSQWIPTKQKTHWRCVDKTIWAKEGKVELKESSVSHKKSYEPRLSSILSKLRQNAETYHGRVYFVYRGLPVWNVNAE